MPVTLTFAGRLWKLCSEPPSQETWPNTEASSLAWPHVSFGPLGQGLPLSGPHCTPRKRRTPTAHTSSGWLWG